MTDRLWPVTPKLLQAGVSVAVFACIAALVITGRPWTTFTMGGWTLGLAPAVFVVGGLLAGPLGVLGACAGYMLGHASLAPVLLFETVGLAVLGNASAFFVGPLKGGGLSHAFGIILAGLIAATTAGSITAWGFALLGHRRYFPAVAIETGQYLIATLLGVAIIVVFASPWQSRTSVEPTHATETDHRTRAVAALAEPMVLVAAWVMAVSTLSVGVQSLRLVPVNQFQVHGLGAIVPLAELAGTSYVLLGVQAALGAVFVTLAARWVCRVATPRDSRGVGQ
jgi:hypothetical protein